MKLAPPETDSGSENWIKHLPFRTSSDFHKYLLNAHLFFFHHGMEFTPQSQTLPKCNLICSQL